MPVAQRRAAAGSVDEGRTETAGRAAGVVLEVTFLPGLEDVVAAEVAEALGPRARVRPVPGRRDALEVTAPAGDDLAARALGLRTAVAVFEVLRFAVPRPRSLTSGEHLPAIVAAMRRSVVLGATGTFRLEAAGADSAVFRRIGDELAAATGMTRDDDGEVVLRFRRTLGAEPAPAGREDPGASGTRGAARTPEVRRDHGTTDGRRAPGTPGAAAPGWDVLVRLGGRPLSARRWRVADYPGAVNATIAAAMVRLAGVRPEDRVVNLMCGSGTLLVERLLAGPAATAVGVDLDAGALDAARANLAAAGVAGRVELVRADVLALGPGSANRVDGPAHRVDGPTDRAGDTPDRSPVGAGAIPSPPTLAATPFDLLLADPPWGTLHGAHADSPALHAGLLRTAHRLAAPGARLVVLTHEVRVMEAALAEAAGLWRLRSQTRVFAKGHHPRIYLLDRLG